jgi:hypothetical protein
VRLQSASGVTLIGNVIGSDIADFDTASQFGNHGDGVGIEGASSGNQIGTVNAGEGNTIAYNTAAGVALYATDPLEESGVSNAIRGNSIHDNSSIGIDLGEQGQLLGPTPNDSAGHTGPNLYQNFPVLQPAVRHGSVVTLHGTLTAEPNAQYEVDLFANQQGSITGYGEGERFLGTLTVHSNASGVATFNATFTGVSALYTVFTATATDVAGNTSEFSQIPSTDTLASTTTLVSSADPSTYGD